MPVESTDLLAVTRPTGAGQGTYKVTVGDLPLPNGTIVSATAPTTTTHPKLKEKDLWYDSTGGRLYIYYNDGSSTQWVDASPDNPPDLAAYSTTVQADAKYVDVAGDTMTGALTVPTLTVTTTANLPKLPTDVIYMARILYSSNAFSKDYEFSPAGITATITTRNNFRDCQFTFSSALGSNDTFIEIGTGVNSTGSHWVGSILGADSRSTTLLRMRPMHVSDTNNPTSFNVVIYRGGS